MIRWMRALVVAGVVVAVGAGSAAADDMRPVNDRWPTVGHRHDPSMGQQIADWMTHLGGDMNSHMALLSHDVMGLTIDGRGQRARLSFHAHGDSIGFDMDNNIHIGNGMAKVHVNLRLRLGSRTMNLHVPMEIVPNDYHGERYVELRLPLLEARW